MLPQRWGSEWNWWALLGDGTRQTAVKQISFLSPPKIDKLHLDSKGKEQNPKKWDYIQEKQEAGI